MQYKVIMGPLLLSEKFVQVWAYLYVNFKDFFVLFFISYIIIIINLFMVQSGKKVYVERLSLKDILM